MALFRLGVSDYSVNKMSPTTGPPPPYDGSTASTSTQYTPTQRQLRARAQKSKAWTQNRTMVSTLPEDEPTPGYGHSGGVEDELIPPSEHKTALSRH